jgi:hypothetical protein
MRLTGSLDLLGACTGTPRGRETWSLSLIGGHAQTSADIGPGTTALEVSLKVLQSASSPHHSWARGEQQTLQRPEQTHAELRATICLHSIELIPSII